MPLMCILWARSYGAIEAAVQSHGLGGLLHRGLGEFLAPPPSHCSRNSC